MTKRGKWGRRKGDFILRYLLAASILAHVAVALSLVAGCNTDYVDSIPLPPALPVGRIVTEAPEEGAGFTAYRFVLEWVREPGILYPDAEYDYDDRVVLATLEQTLKKWKEYTRLIDPRPFYDSVGTGGSLDDYFNGEGNRDSLPYYVVSQETGSLKLDNADPRNGNIIIRRYWPKLTDTLGKPAPLNRGTWLNSVDIRKAAFKKAAAEIEGMMAEIAASPYYSLYAEIRAPLMELHQAMADYIAYNPPLEQCAQRDEINWSIEDNGSVNARAEAILPAGRTGPLYEYYLGHVPHPNEYHNPDGPYAFPE